MITFTSEADGEKVVVETDSVHIACVIDAFKRFLLAAGFHPDNIKEYINED